VVCYRLDKQALIPNMSRNFSLCCNIQTSCGANPAIMWLLGALYLGIKQPEHKVDHSSPQSPEIRNMWSFISMSLIGLNDMVIRHEGNFSLLTYWCRTLFEKLIVTQLVKK
jgi:hypothetical protein